MKKSNEMPDPTDALLTEQDQEDLQSMQDEPLRYTLLESWREVLSNIEAVHADDISPALAVKICASWPLLKMQDLPAYHEHYFDLLIQHRDAVADIIIDFPGCLKNTDPDIESEFHDATANKLAYLELIFEWQMISVRAEKAWKIGARDSHIVVAALADAQAFMTGPKGLIQHFSHPQINFQYSTDDEAAMRERIEQARAEL